MRGKAEDEGPDPVDVHVGLAVKAYRLRAGMNQQALGKAVKVTFQQIQKYEKGANRISASMLHRIASVLDFHPGDVFPVHGVEAAGSQAGFGAIKGSYELAESFSRMPAPNRALLLKVAREFERPDAA